MSDDMLISFDSPAVAKIRDKAPNRNGLSSPLIPCPSTPFDLVPPHSGGDPFELEPQDPFAVQPDVSPNVKANVPEASTLAPPGLDIPTLDAATPSPLLLRRAMSDVDISGVVPGQYLVSSTPLVSNANTPTRSSRSVPRRSVLNESISCALVKSKLDFINKVNQNLAVSAANPVMTRSKSISNLAETHDTSVQHKIFSSTKAVISHEKDIIPREQHSTNFSPVDSSKVDFSSFIRDTDVNAKHETSALLSFLTSPKHVMVGTKVSTENLRKEAEKLQFLFSLCAKDDYNPAKEKDDCEWISSSCVPEAWFDDSLDLDNILTSDSDEDVNVPMYAKRRSTQEDMEAIKIRLNRFRRSAGPDEDKRLKKIQRTAYQKNTQKRREPKRGRRRPPSNTMLPIADLTHQVLDPKEPVPPSKTNPPVTSDGVTGVQPVTSSVEVQPVEAPPVVVAPVVPPRLPIVPEVRMKAPNAAPARKGPLKAVEPVPNMIKKSLSSDMLKSALARGRPSSRPSSEQGPRRQDSPATRRSNSIPPRGSGSTPTVKKPHPPLKGSGVRVKPILATGKGKENRL